MSLRNLIGAKRALEGIATTRRALQGLPDWMGAIALVPAIMQPLRSFSPL